MNVIIVDEKLKSRITDSDAKICAIIHINILTDTIWNNTKSNIVLQYRSRPFTAPPVSFAP